MWSCGVSTSYAGTDAYVQVNNMYGSWCTYHHDMNTGSTTQIWWRLVPNVANIWLIGENRWNIHYFPTFWRNVGDNTN